MSIIIDNNSKMLIRYISEYLYLQEGKIELDFTNNKKDYSTFIKISNIYINSGDDRMIYKINMLCKHFKGKDLLEKNIYRIEKLGVNGSDINESLITYTGDGDLKLANKLVIYSNIFQNNKLFCREYEDISKELSEENKKIFNQTIKVQPLTEEEIFLVNSSDFIKNKSALVAKKFSKKM